MEKIKIDLDMARELEPGKFDGIQEAEVILDDNGNPEAVYAKTEDGLEMVIETSPPQGPRAQGKKKGPTMEEKYGEMEPMKYPQPEIEDRLKDLGIITKVGRSWKITPDNFIKFWNLRARGGLSPREYAYGLFFAQVPPALRKGKPTIFYKELVGGGVPTYWVLNKEKRRGRPQKDKPIKGNFPTGKHLIDNILINHRINQQGNLFDTLLPVTKDRLNRTQTTAEYINRKGEGIKLSKEDYMLILCLSKILHEKSQNTNNTGKDYYSGNMGYEVVKWGTQQGEIEVMAPKIGITPYEIAKEYYGGDNIGGENVRVVSRMLYNLADDPDKKALMRYKRVVRLSKDKTREYFIERYESLISIATAGYKDFLNGNQIDERRDLVIILHPIIRDQIENKSVDFPIDITRRMIEAYGSHNIPEMTNRLVLELARQYSGRRSLPKDEEGNHIYTIGAEKLYWKIAENYMNPKTGNPRKGPKLRKYFLKSIETCISLGILHHYTERNGKTGDLLIDFYLSKKWE